MGYRIVLVFLVWLASACTNFGDEKNTDDNFTVSFEKVLEITGEDAIENSWVVEPRNIAIDNEGHIYLTDEKRNFIQKFDSDGQFIKKIGGQGGGPGEFDNLYSIFADSVVIGFSRGSMRMVKFGLNGDLLASYPIQGVNGKTNMYRLGEQFLLFHVNYSTNPEDDYGLHSYNQHFEKAGPSQMEVSELYRSFNNDVANIAFLLNNSIYFINETQFLVAPALYTGQVFKYELNQENGQWEQMGAIEGTPLENHYSMLNHNERADLMLLPAGADEPLAYRIHGESLFLSRLNDGRFVHFIKRDEESQREYGVELFDEDLEYLGYDVLLTDPTPLDDEHIVLYPPKAKDSRDWFYSIDYGEGGVKVVAHRLELKE